ncbi:phage tail family protein [Bacillus sp. FSL W7-1360]
MSVVYIEDKATGEVFDCEKFGITTEEFDPHSLEQKQTIKEVPGSHGYIYVPDATTYAGRTIDWNIFIKAINSTHLLLKRKELFSLLSKREEFFVYTRDEPNKLYSVTAPDGWKLEKVAHYAGRAPIQLKSSSPFSVSRGTLEDKFHFSGIWSFGMNIPIQLDEITYRHYTDEFTIWNLGDKEIDPRRLNEPLKILIEGKTENLAIENQTTSDVWQYRGKTNSDDVIVIEDVFAYKNSRSIIADTNKATMRLASGANHFKLHGVTGAIEIRFDFRFLFI